MAYVYQEYPRCLHRADGTTKVVQNVVELDAALFQGWSITAGSGLVIAEPEPAAVVEPEPDEPEHKRGRSRKG